MKIKFLVAAFFVLSAGHSMAQQKVVRSSKALRDSIENKYVKNGAERFSYFSHEWQNYLDSALAITPDNASLWELKSMPYDKSRKYEVGEKYLNKAVELDPYEYLGLRAFQKCIFYKKYREALIDYEGALKLRGNYTMMEHPYSFYQGICYLGLNEFDSAMNYFNKTIELEEKTGGESFIHFMDWFYKGITLMEREEYSEAIIYFDKTLMRYKNFSDAQYYKSICLRKTGEPGEANKMLEEAHYNFKKGYSFTEDNAVYEKYPYQLSGYMVQYHGKAM